jgi:ubiquinone/menaquinone biosynthesis C-methylase UbiE
MTPLDLNSGSTVKVVRMETADAPTAPNHHAGQGEFAGFTGLLVGLSMAIGRSATSRWAIQLTGAASGDRVVDIGCGPGAAVRYAARCGMEVIGVDPAPQMLRLARRLTRSSDALTYVEAGAEALPIDEASAAAAWSIASVHHWTDVGAGVREVRRVLAPGARFAALERHTIPRATGLRSHGWTDDQAAEFARLCSAQGFVDVRIDHARTGRRRRVVAVVATNPT